MTIYSVSFVPLQQHKFNTICMLKQDFPHLNFIHIYCFTHFFLHFLNVKLMFFVAKQHNFNVQNVHFLHFIDVTCEVHMVFVLKPNVSMCKTLNFTFIPHMAPVNFTFSHVKLGFPHVKFMCCFCKDCIISQPFIKLLINVSKETFN